MAITSIWKYSGQLAFGITYLACVLYVFANLRNQNEIVFASVLGLIYVIMQRNHIKSTLLIVKLDQEHRLEIQKLRRLIKEYDGNDDVANT